MVIDFTYLPRPSVIETLDYEAIVADIKSYLIAADANLAPVLGQESAVVTKLVGAFAYREMLLRKRVNDAANAVLLPYATGTDLDNVAGGFGVVRLVVTPAAGETPAVMEDDERLRRRVQLRQDAYSVAGSAGAYEYFALTAVPSLKDAVAISPTPGTVRVSIMASGADPVPPTEHVTAVLLALDEQTVRPLTDVVSVTPVVPVEVDIVARLTLYPGPDGALVAAAARTKLADLLKRVELIDYDLRRSAIYSALHVEGVQSVELVSPAQDVVVDKTQCVFVNSSTVTVEGRDR